MTNKELLDKIYDTLDALIKISFKEWDEAINVKEFDCKKCSKLQGETQGLMIAKDIIYDLYREVND